MNNLLKTLLLGGSATALMAGAAVAQQGGLGVEEIQSSVSRIDLKGFEAPTPVTVVGIETLNRDAKVNLGDQIRELPQVRSGGSLTFGSFETNLSQINAGTDSVAIRGLEAKRNLVLFDRQRVVTDAVQDYVVNLSLIPAGLTQRVDVVTGGASAAWGSDAVTGVINVVINKTFEGFKGNVNYSDNTGINNPVYKLSLAWGTSFLDGRGHTVWGADFVRSDTAVFNGAKNVAFGNDGRTFVYNTAYCNAITGSTCSSVAAGQPLLVYAFGVSTNTQNVVGGLVQNNTAGVAGSSLTTTNALKGVMFVGEDATPSQFNYGTTFSNNGTLNCYNGCTNDQYGSGDWGMDTNPYHTSTFFNYTSFQILPDLKASIQLNYARQTILVGGGTINFNGQTIYADNPFLPQEIARRFVCQGGTAGDAICNSTLSNGYNPYTLENDTGATTLAQRQGRPAQTLQVGFELVGNRDNNSPTSGLRRESVNYDYNDRCQALSNNCGRYGKALMRGVFTLEGIIGDAWSWNAYLQQGQTRVKENVQNPILRPRVNNAFDAVRITSGNVGASGLAIGSVQCRGLLNNALASPTPADGIARGLSTLGELAGCVPFDPFGDGVISNASRNYIMPSNNPDKNGRGFINTVTAYANQTVASYSMSGVLPWQVPAGEVGVAFGGEYRMEQSGIKNVDVRAQSGMYNSGGFGVPYSGTQHVEEGFLEVAIPILKNDIVQTLNFDMAGRLTNYSNSGLVETWKLGLQSQLNDEARIRVTWSHDIRAPNIYDLNAPGSRSANTCANTGFIETNQSCTSVTDGNKNLNPERANTIAAGVVFTPTWLEGFTASLDWYQIHITGAIVTPAQNDAAQFCKAGDTFFCTFLEYAQGLTDVPSGLPYPAGQAAGKVLIGHRSPINAGVFQSAGFDFSVAYGFDLFTGNMDVSFNGNYEYDHTRRVAFRADGSDTITFQAAGTTGGYCTSAEPNFCGQQKFRGTLGFDYREGPWSLGLQFRIFGESIMDPGRQGQVNMQAEQTVTYSVVNGVNVANVTSGTVRNPITGKSTNYNAPVVGTDLRVQYRWSNNITLFAAMDNAQNLPQGVLGSLRRSYRMGVRWNY